MKQKHFLLLLIMALPFVSKGQDTLRFYFDEYWKPTSDYLAHYYRDMYKSGSLWTITDYYQNGQVEMKGASLTLNTDDKQGPFTYYYKNGNKQEEGNYNHGKRTGKWTWRYKNGAIESLGNYNANGELNGTWKSFYKNGQLRGSGNYKEGQQVGQWKWYFNNGQKSAVEQYMNDSLQLAHYWNKDGSKLKNPKEAIQDFEFPGGQSSLRLYLLENISYPEDIRNLGISGIVYVSFIVGVNGSISDIRILRSPHQKLSEIVIATIEKMPRWKPAKNHNIISESKANLPVKFTLTE